MSTPEERPRFTVWSFGRNLHQTAPFPYLASRESVREQPFASWEMILLDDASEDDTQAWLANERIHPPDARIRYVRTPERRGKMQNFLDQFPSFRGEIAIELDADDWLGEDALARIDRAYLNGPTVECTLGRWRDHGKPWKCSGNVHDVRELRPRGVHSYPAPRTWKVDLMRRAIERYPDFWQDPRYGTPWRSSADCAIIQPILHCAERVVDLGNEIYWVNDHDQRDGVLDRSSQWDTTAYCLGVWERIRVSEGLRAD